MEVKVRTKLNAYRFMLIDKLKKELKELKWFEENDHEFFKLYLGMVKDTEKELKEVEDILSENNYPLVSSLTSTGGDTYFTSYPVGTVVHLGGSSCAKIEGNNWVKLGTSYLP